MGFSKQWVGLPEQWVVIRAICTEDDGYCNNDIFILLSIRSWEILHLYNQVHITREDTLRELKKLLGLKLDVFFYVFPGTCNVKSTFFFAHPTIFLCISVIFTGFFTSVSTSNFFYALTSVMPFDFIERSDRAVFMLALGDTIVGYCLDRVSRLAGLALVVEGMGV